MRGKPPRDDLGAGIGLVVVAGATAAGKTRLSLDLAERLGGEIVNGDAMQTYRGLDIGTAKPAPEQRRGIPHHLFELWDVTHPASVAEYQRSARDAIAAVQARGRPAILVGGSPLYLRAVCDQLCIPPTDPDVRRDLQRRAEREGAAALHEELRRADPAAAEAIDPRNLRRVVRALEVVRLTGSFTARLEDLPAWRPSLWLGVDVERGVLDARIAERAGRMWQGGLLAETRRLLAQGLRDGPTARKAVGYQQAIAVLDGDIDPGTGLAQTVRATQRLARRQQRAFRAARRITWVGGPDDIDEALAAGGSGAAGTGRAQGSRR